MKEVNSVLFRSEEGGTLVYDSAARLPDEVASSTYLPVRKISQNLRREIESANEYDQLQFTSMLDYPPNKPILNQFTLVIPTSSLRFDSKFESGNLKKAIMITPKEYLLFLEYDTESQGHTQWFYFSAKNTSPIEVKFSIVNLMKPKSLFNQGMRVLVKSEHNGEWQRGCSDISYAPNDRRRGHSNPKLPRTYFTLSFEYKFEHPNDKVWFACCYPYTYSDLNAYLSSLNSNCLRIDSLCHTLAGNKCPLLTITNNIKNFASWEVESQMIKKSKGGRQLIRSKMIKKFRKKEKKLVFVIGRVHPGETTSSFVVQGLIDFLLSNEKKAIKLRNNFIFRIIPMLNPDGVIYGNTRCSLLGVDLNRRWKYPNKYLHPTVFHAKKLIQTMSEEIEPLLFLDIHGHSIRKNAFFYGCRIAESGFMFPKSNIYIRLMPFLVAQRTELVQYSDSRFRNERLKMDTARLVVFNEAKVLNSFTLETSLMGTETRLFDPELLYQLGAESMAALTTYTSNWVLQQQIRHFTQLFLQHGNNIDAYNYKVSKRKEEKKSVVNVKNHISMIPEDIKEDSDDESGGSDSCPSDDDDKKQRFLEEIRLRNLSAPEPAIIDTTPKVPKIKDDYFLRQNALLLRKPVKSRQIFASNKVLINRPSSTLNKSDSINNPVRVCFAAGAYKPPGLVLRRACSKSIGNSLSLLVVNRSSSLNKLR